MRPNREKRRRRFAERFMDARGKVGMTQLEMAQAMGASLKQVSNWEAGRHFPRPAQMRKLSKILKESLEYFYGERKSLTKPRKSVCFSCMVTREFATVVFAAMLIAPAGLGQTGTVYVAEYSSGTIERFDLSTGTDLGAFATGPAGLGQGLTLDRAGNLYATFGGVPSSSWGIEKFTPDGVGSFFGSTSPWHAPPYQLTVDRAGNVYAAVTGGGTDGILRFTPSGAGSLFATIAVPNALVCDSAGNVYVSEANEIEKFTPDGVGSFFASVAQNTDGLAFDGAGNLYAANLIDGTITKFTPGGVGSLFATTASGTRTSALAFDSADNLYALSFSDGTIEKFTPDGVGSVFANGLGTAYSLVIQEVPEPSALALFSLGLSALLAFQLATPSGGKHDRPQ